MSHHRPALAAAVAVAVLSTPAPARAAITPYASTSGGASTNANGADENEFRTAVGTFNEPGDPSLWRNDRARSVTWEDETSPPRSLDAFASPASLPGTYYNGVVPEGLVLESPGTGFTVSQDDDTGADADPDLTGFKDVLPAYNFLGTSGQRRLAVRGSRIVDFRFFRAGTDIPATVQSFGLQLSGVDLPGTTFQAFDEQGVSLDLRSVPVKAATGLSFVGLTATDRIARVRLVLGTDVLGTAEDATHDVVTIDDVLYAEPWRGLPALSLAASTSTAAEADGLARVVVRRTGVASGSASVDYATADGTAKSNEDYTAASGTLTFADGELSRTIDVPLATDTRTEGDETFTLRLTGAKGGALVTPEQTTVTVSDAPAPSAGGGTVTTPATTVTQTVTRTTPPPADTKAPVVTISGVAAKVKLAAFRKGLTVKVATDEPAALEVALQTTARKAKIAAAYNLALASRELSRAAGTRSVRLKPDAALLRGAKRFKVRISVTAVDAAGNASRTTRVVSVA